MYHLFAAYLLGISSDRTLLGRPYIQPHFPVGTIHGDTIFRTSVTKQILIRSQEVIIMNHRCFQFFAHCQILIREVLFTQHMIASQFQMRTAQSKHDSIRQQNTRRIKFPPVIRLVIIHISCKNRIQLIIAIYSIFIKNSFQIGKISLIRPYFIIEEIHFIRLPYLTGTVTAHRIHHQALVRMHLLHCIYKRGISLTQVNRNTTIIIKRATSSQLVYLITIESEVCIYIVIPFAQIFLPFLVRRIYQINITFPSARQVMAILSSVRSILKQIPFLLHSIRSSIFQRSETKIIKHRLHTETMLRFNVIFHRTCINLPVSDIHIYLIQLYTCTAQRPVMFIMPILKLHPVDMMTVQILHLFLCLFGCLLLTEISDKTITRETCRITGYIYRNRTDYYIRSVLLTIKLCHVPFKISGRRLPCPARTIYRFFSHRFTRKAITYFSSGRQSVIHCKHHFLSRFVESLVCRQVYTQIRCYRSHFGDTARSSSILLVRLIIITASHTQESSYQIYYFFHLEFLFYCFTIEIVSFNWSIVI